MKICVVIDAFSVGGAQRVLHSLIPEWVKDGHVLELILLQSAEVELDTVLFERAGVRIIRIESKSLLDFKAFFLFRRHLRRFNPDLIHAHLFWSQIWTKFAYLWKTPDFGIFWIEHNTYLNRTRAQWFLFKFLYSLKLNLIAVSQEVKDYLDTRGIHGAKVIFNPISPDYFRLVHTSRKNVVLFVGRLNDQKNPMLAIEGFEFAFTHQWIPSDSEFWIAGSGPLTREVIARTQQSVCSHQFKFLGFLSEIELADIFQFSRTLVSTSKFEGFALVRPQALAAGCTVVTTPTAGIRGVLTNSISDVNLVQGVFLIDSSPQGLAEGLQKSMLGEYWTVESVNQRRESVSRFAPSVIAQEYLTLKKN